VKEALGELHGISLEGYLGIRKTLNKVRQWYYWLHMRSMGRGAADNVTSVHHAEAPEPRAEA
jgi:hypothetical protein